jgi:hypothetical protein
MQLRNIVDDQRPKQVSHGVRTRQIVCIIIPLLVVVGCGFTLLITCYPKAVFLRGDEVERYPSMIQRRKLLCSIVIGVPIVGLLGNLLVIGVCSWLPLD